MKVIVNLQRINVFELFEHWTMLIVFDMGHNQTKIQENFILEFPKKHDQTSIFAEGVYNVSPVRLSIYLSLRPSVTHLSQDLYSGFS